MRPFTIPPYRQQCQRDTTHNPFTPPVVTTNKICTRNVTNLLLLGLSNTIRTFKVVGLRVYGYLVGSYWSTLRQKLGKRARHITSTNLFEARGAIAQEQDNEMLGEHQKICPLTRQSDHKTCHTCRRSSPERADHSYACNQDSHVTDIGLS